MNKKPMIADELLKHATFVRRLAIHLTGDRQKAEDIEQDVWLAVAKRPPQEKKSIRGWLRVVVKNLAAKQGLEEARRPRVIEPSSIDAMSTKSAGSPKDRSLLQSVVTNVLNLPEPYQTLVLLRYYQGHTVREIGEQVGSTHAKVRHQLGRALELLESSLTDAHDGTLKDWRGSLALVCGIGTTMTKTTKVVGAGLIMAKAKTIGLSALVILICAVGYIGLKGFFDSDESILITDPNVAETTTKKEARRDVDGTKINSATTDTSAPTKVQDPQEAINPESVQLEVVWEVDGTPARDVFIGLSERSKSGRTSKIQYRRTDQQGGLLIERMPKDRLIVSTPRCLNQDLARLQPGTTGLVKVLIPVGIEVRGMVVDQTGSAIVGADILISGSNTFARTTKVATSGSDGSFALHQISTRSYVAARHRDFAPSNLFTPPASVGGAAKIPLTLVLDSKWCRLTGRLTGPNGDPIEGALIKAGQNRWQRQTDATGTARYTTPANMIRTGADGVFDTGRLAAGKVDLFVATSNPNWAIHQQVLDMNVAETRQVDIQLKISPTLYGVIQDEQGKAVAGAFISPDFYDADIHKMVTHAAFSDSTGRFELKGLKAGPAKLRARLKSGAQVFHKVDFKNGVRHEWNPVFILGARVFGRLVDESGKGLARWTVNGTAKSGQTWRQSTETDQLGRFELTQCPENRDLKLSFSHHKITSSLPALMKTVRASGSEVLARLLNRHLPRSRISGKVVDGKGNRPPRVTIWLGLEDSDTMRGFARLEKDGSFEIGPISKGRYKMKVEATGFGEILMDPIDLKSKETKDLGTIQFKDPARLILDISYPNGKPTRRVFVDISKDNRNAEQVIIEGQKEASFPLAPGTYSISVKGSTGAVVETTQKVKLLPAMTTRFHIKIEVP